MNPNLTLSQYAFILEVAAPTIGVSIPVSPTKKPKSFSECFEILIDYYSLVNSSGPRIVQDYLFSKGLKGEDDILALRNKVSEGLRLLDNQTADGTSPRPLSKSAAHTANQILSAR